MTAAPASFVRPVPSPTLPLPQFASTIAAVVPTTASVSGTVTTRQVVAEADDNGGWSAEELLIAMDPAWV